MANINNAPTEADKEEAWGNSLMPVEAQAPAATINPISQSTEQQNTMEQPPLVSAQDSSLTPDAFVERPKPSQPVQQPQPQSNDLNSVNKSFTREQQAVSAAADAGALKATELASQLEKTASIQAEQAIKYQELSRNIQEKSNAEIAKLGEVQKKMENFEFKDYWEDKSTPQKIVALIAVALGGIGGGMAGQENMGLKMINTAIDRDIQRQKMQFEKMQHIGQVSNNILGQMNAQYDNTFMAEKATEATLLNASQTKLEAIAAKYQSPELKAKAAQLYEQLERQKLGALQQMRQEIATNTMMGSLAQGSQGQDISAAQLQRLPKEVREVYVPGYGLAANKELANKFSADRSEIEPGINGAKRILDLTKDFNRVTDLKTRAQVQTELQALVGQLRLPFTGPGAMTDKEYERLAATIGDPTSFTSIQSLQRKKLETVLKKLQGDLKNKAKAAGLPIKEKPMLNFSKPINK